MPTDVFRFLRGGLLALLAAVPLAASVPAELQTAIAAFRTEPPKGWAFTQTTVAEGKSTVERYEAARPEFDRWKLLSVDGRKPNPDELARYGDTRARRSRGGTAPHLGTQLDPASARIVGDDGQRLTLQLKLKPGELSDRTAEHLQATLVWHKATRAIERLELGNTAEFSPAFGVTIRQVRTAIGYSLPEGDTPALPREVSTRQRGTAFWFKTLDAEMSVTFTDYVRVRPKPAAAR
jgi:hypothetical protein